MGGIFGRDNPQRRKLLQVLAAAVAHCDTALATPFLELAKGTYASCLRARNRQHGFKITPRRLLALLRGQRIRGDAAHPWQASLRLSAGCIANAAAIN
jgi:hypothetical protein